MPQAGVQQLLFRWIEGKIETRQQLVDEHQRSGQDHLVETEPVVVLCSHLPPPYRKNTKVAMMNVGTSIGSEYLSMYPKKEGIGMPDSSAIDLTMKFGAFPM